MTFKLILLLLLQAVSLKVIDGNTLGWLPLRPATRIDRTAELPFRNTSLSWKERVSDLVSRLTIDEVIAQLTRGGAGPNGPAPAIKRLGILPYQWVAECLHGYGYGGAATSFPQAIGLSATFNPSIIRKVANATGAEARAKHIYDMSVGNYADHTGMSCFSPVVNIMRHPLWGRNQETYGEDTYLSGQMATAFVKALQGDRSTRFFQASATCKHFDAYSGPENIPITRFAFNAVVSQRDFELTYFPAFEACIAAGARGVMCSYNSVNGIPACANKWLLTDTLRRRWNYTGYVISDEGALEFMLSFHHAFKDVVVAAATAMNAGTNLELGMNTSPVYGHLSEAMARGLVNETYLRQMLEPLFETRMRLGEFDPVTHNPYASYKMQDLVQSWSHRQISLEAALASFVLLKSEDGFLPWTPASPEIDGLVLIGPFGRNMGDLYGDYAPARNTTYEITIERGLSAMTTVNSTVDGCIDGPVCNKYDPKSVIAAVSTAKLIVLTIGTGQNVESESKDRVSLELPNLQAQLLKDVLNYSQPTAKILILIFTASPVNIGAAVTSSKVKAILWCGFPAQTAGEAVAIALSPVGAVVVGGRLPFTWYANDEQVPGRTDYLMHNQTYRYLPPNVVPQFPFGYGLSLTKFQYDNLVVPSQISHTDNLQIEARVRNVGQLPGQEVVQVYIQWPSKEDMPLRQLAGFTRTNALFAGQSLSLKFSVSPAQRRVWRNNTLQAFSGQLNVFVGGQQPEQRVLVPSNVLKAVVNII